MLRITVELVPRGIEAAKRCLAKGEIINTGDGDWDTGKYTYSFCCPASRVAPNPISVTGRLDGYDRSRGALELLYEALKDALED